MNIKMFSPFPSCIFSCFCAIGLLLRLRRDVGTGETVKLPLTPELRVATMAAADLELDFPIVKMCVRCLEASRSSVR
jgi:hypothetical protein